MALWYLMGEDPDYRERIHRGNNFPFEDCWHCGTPSRNAYDVFSPMNELSRQLDPFYSLSTRNRRPRDRYFKVHDHHAQSSPEGTSTTEKAPQEGEPKTFQGKNAKDNQEKLMQSTDHPHLRNMLSLKEVFPNMQRTSDGPFEMNVHLGDCDPDKLKVEFKNGLLKVEGRNESSDGSFSFVRHERTLPKGVKPSTLKASLLPGGTLKIRQHLDTVDIPVTMGEGEENENSTEDDSKKQNMSNDDKQMEEA